METKRRGLILLVMTAGMFLILLDVTVVNVAVPTITAGLRTSTAGVQWVVDGYTVALASLLLAGGTLGDRFGHRQTVLAGLAVFGAASAGCALAATPGTLIAARVVQGIGAALLLPGSLAAIADAYPGRAEQARALGLWAAASSLALPAGPLLGGLIVSTLGWRAVFWINPPIVAACLIGVLTLIRPSPHPRPGQRFDLGGLGLATLALASAVYAVIAAGDSAGPAAVAAAAVAFASGSGFIAVERRAASPLIPLSVFANQAFRVANTAALVMNLTANGLLFLLTRYLQSVQAHSALAAGLMLLPLFAPMAVLSPLAGRLAARRGPRPVMIAGAALAAAGMLGLLAVTPVAPYARILPALAGMGLGIGTFTAPVVAAAIRALPPDRSGLASGINNTARQAGTALGVAVFGAIAGSPSEPQHFVTALRILGAASALLWLLVIVMTVRVRPTPEGRPSEAAVGRSHPTLKS
jgi:MFS transporter, DHA2 family, methylenomycin A resistance protein